MRNSAFRACLKAIDEQLAIVHLGAEHARANLQTWAGIGYPNRSGGPLSGSGTSDPTAAAALAALDREERDNYARLHRELEVHLTTARSALQAAARIVDQNIGGTELPGAEGCWVCDHAYQPTGVHHCSKDCADREHKHPEHWQPIYVHRTRPTGGARVGYCSFDTEFIDRYGVEPARAVTLWHLDHLGSQVPRGLIREHHPAEFDRYHVARRSA